MVAAVLWIVTAPVALAVHLTPRRERVGRPVIGIFLRGTLGVCVEYTGLLMFA